MADGIVGGVRRASGWSIALGILMIIAGMIAIFAPLEAGLVVVIVVGLDGDLQWRRTAFLCLQS